MLLIATKIAPSPVHGIGLFANQFIPKGTVTWQFHPEFDKTYSEQEMLRMPDAARAIFLNYAYYDKDLALYVLCSDDQRFINHTSEQPNIISTPNRDVAGRDILPGEELLCDYNDYDDTYFIRNGMPSLASPFVDNTPKQQVLIAKVAESVQQLTATLHS
jgi:uncharacterized protein